MKRKKLNMMNIGEGEFRSNGALSRDEMKSIIAGCCYVDPNGCSGGGQQCNCLYCYLSNGGLQTYAADCASNPPNPNWYCKWFTGDIGATGNYGIC